jgi:hypothetical protein
MCGIVPRIVARETAQHFPAGDLTSHIQLTAAVKLSSQQRVCPISANNMAAVAERIMTKCGVNVVLLNAIY